MNWFVAFVASGLAFFPGVALVIAGVWMDQARWPIGRRLSTILLSIGLILAIASSTPMPAPLVGAAIVVLSWWLVAKFRKRGTAVARIAVTLTAVVMVGNEARYHTVPTCELPDDRKMIVIGDSVTAGVGAAGVETWPAILERRHGLQIRDFSHVGETAASALQRIDQEELTANFAVIEIGGNDLLGGTTAPEFGRDLDSLLDAVCRSGREVILFELPLPPFYHAYGRVQRQVARKRGVRLVPKWVLMSVFVGHETTLDSIHLSQAGHKRFADIVDQMVAMPQ